MRNWIKIGRYKVILLTPKHVPLFSELYGYTKPLIKLFGYRVMIKSAERLDRELMELDSIRKDQAIRCRIAEVEAEAFVDHFKCQDIQRFKDDKCLAVCCIREATMLKMRIDSYGGDSSILDPVFDSLRPI